MICVRCGNPTGHVTRDRDGAVVRDHCPELMRLIRLARRVSRRGFPTDLVKHSTIKGGGAEGGEPPGPA